MPLEAVCGLAHIAALAGNHTQNLNPALSVPKQYLKLFSRDVAARTMPARNRFRLQKPEDAKYGTMGSESAGRHDLGTLLQRDQ